MAVPVRIGGGAAAAGENKRWRCFPTYGEVSGLLHWDKGALPPPSRSCSHYGIKEFKKSYEILDILRFPVFALYLATFLFDITGLKKYARHYLILTMNLLRIKGGFQELFSILLYPRYVSPYDNCSRRK